MNEPAHTLTVLRRCLLALLFAGFIGTLAELLLSGHTEDFWQLVPLVLLGAGALLLALGAAWRAAAVLRLFQALMAVFVTAGIVGGWLHYRAKTEIVLERVPSLRGAALFRESLEGSSPPLLAPGTMIALGLLGLTWTYRHPALSRSPQGASS